MGTIPKMLDNQDDLLAMKPIVVYIDDEPLNLSAFEIVFRKFDWELFLYEDVQDALKDIALKKPWVVISDQRMPVMTGVELLERVKLLSPKSIRIVVTAYSDEELIIDSIRKVNVYDYIKKPWQPEDLRVSIGRAVDYYKKCMEKEIAEKNEISTRVELETARELARHKAIFINNMSHELRTPLTAILGSANLILDDIQHIDDSQDKDYYLQIVSSIQPYIKFIMDAGQDLLKLIIDLLDMSKAEGGKFLPKYQSINVEVFIESIIPVIEPLSKNNANQLITEITPGLNVFSDKAILKQIMLNLLGNACKFTDHGQISIKVKELDGIVCFTVRDTGIGISPEAIEKIFNPFTQATELTKSKYGGIGLGLAICKQFSQLIHGDIFVESEEGKGSTFTVIVPVSPSADYINKIPNQFKDQASSLC